MRETKRESWRIERRRLRGEIWDLFRVERRVFRDMDWLFEKRRRSFWIVGLESSSLGSTSGNIWDPGSSIMFPIVIELYRWLRTPLTPVAESHTSSLFLQLLVFTLPFPRFDSKSQVNLKSVSIFHLVWRMNNTKSHVVWLTSTSMVEEIGRKRHLSRGCGGEWRENRMTGANQEVACSF